jgi:hypothetical protein
LPLGIFGPGVETLEANDGEVGGRGSFEGKASIWRCDMLDCVEWLKSRMAPHDDCGHDQIRVENLEMTEKA